MGLDKLPLFHSVKHGFFLEVDQSKDNHEVKSDDKTSNNPLINLANAVNSITNGNMEETNVLEPLPTTVNKQAPCKAIVKPQVLTHVIEGFVIQECKFYQLIFFIFQHTSSRS